MTERSAENELSMFTHKQDGYRLEAAYTLFQTQHLLQYKLYNML